MQTGTVRPDRLADMASRQIPRSILVTGMAVMVLFIGGFLAWALLAPLEAAVTAQGDVIFDSRRKTVQHLEGGIVERILVREGDEVTAGQPLILLDDQMVRPVVAMLEDQSIAERATIARLEAEKSGDQLINFPQTIRSRSKDPVVARIIETETRLFEARLNAHKSEVEILRSQVLQTREGITGMEGALREVDKEITALAEQLEANRSLLKEGYVTRTVVLDLERLLAEKTGSREQVRANLAQLKQRLAEFELRISSHGSLRIKEAVAEMKEATVRRIELEEKVRPSRNALDRQIIRAPISGKVVDLKVTTVGGVIASREPLMDIAPSSDHLILEAKIGVNDIHDVRTGQHASVNLTAFKSSTTPPVEATVSYISPDRLTTQTPHGEMPYYTVHLEFDPLALKTAGVTLYPGMSAQASITTRARTAFDYFTSPLRDRLGRAFHEK